MEDNKIIDITRDIKRAERKARWRARIDKVKQFVDENREVLVVAVPAVTGAVATGIKVLGKRRNLAVEERNKDRRVYDARLGHYWELRRKLSNREWSAIDRRMKNGERLSEILDELRVLK